MDRFEAELHAIALRSSSEFRVLRKLARRMIYDRPLPAKIKTGLIVDVETTGLNPNADEIIEIGMVRFAYTPGGTVLGLLADFSAFREPSHPIPHEITRMTGITHTMVAGHRIHDEQIRKFVESADIVIAHNAGFDRRFCERLCPVFVTKPWACSQTQIQWSAEGVEGTKRPPSAPPRGVALRELPLNDPPPPDPGNLTALRTIVTSQDRQQI